MEEDELFDEFYAKLKDIVNSAFNLGETIPEPKIVRKVLKSLPNKFHADRGIKGYWQNSFDRVGW